MTELPVKTINREIMALCLGGMDALTDNRTHPVHPKLFSGVFSIAPGTRLALKRDRARTVTNAPGTTPMRMRSGFITFRRHVNGACGREMAGFHGMGMPVLSPAGLIGSPGVCCDGLAPAAAVFACLG
jgi:hypothetical protein